MKRESEEKEGSRMKGRWGWKPCERASLVRKDILNLTKLLTEIRSTRFGGCIVLLVVHQHVLP